MVQGFLHYFLNFNVTHTKIISYFGKLIIERSWICYNQAPIVRFVRDMHKSLKLHYGSSILMVNVLENWMWLQAWGLIVLLGFDSSERRFGLLPLEMFMGRRIVANFNNTIYLSLSLRYVHCFVSDLSPKRQSVIVL